MNDFVKCVKSQKNDAFSIAKLHKQGIPTGFLSQQSNLFLQKLYLYLIEHELVYVIKYREKIVGFIAGSVSTKGLYKKFLKNNRLLLVKFIFSNIFSAEIMRKALETLKAPEKSDTEESDEELPELLSIVVDQAYSGKDYGRQLLQKFEEALKKEGINTYKVLVGSQLEANKFYANNGFIKKREIELHKGSISYIYVKNISTKDTRKK